MRLLFLGDLAQTGFGTVTYELGKALLDEGIDLRFCSFNEPNHRGWWHDLPEWIQDRAASFDNPDGWLVYDNPETQERLRRMFSGGLFRDGWAPEAALILGDPGSLAVSPVLDVIPEGMPAWNYVPIEGAGSPPAWRVLWENVQPVSMSKFGAQELTRLLDRDVPYVHHGINADIFHPPSKDHPLRLLNPNSGEVWAFHGRKECKEFLGIDPDSILILRCDRNVQRKRYPSLLRALAPVLAKHPEARFLWHCLSVDEGGDMFAFRSHQHPFIGNRMQPTGFHDDRQAIGPDFMAVLYAAADVYVSVSSEGFGLTIAEAMACGTPVVAMDFSSVSEVVGAEPVAWPVDIRTAQTRWLPGGVLVPPGFFDDNIYGYFWAGVNERAFSTALMQVVEMTREERRQMGLKASLHVHASFNWQRAAKQFVEIMNRSISVEVAA